MSRALLVLRSNGRRAVSLAAALGVALTALVVLQSPAAAVPNPSVVVSDVTLTTDPPGNDQSTVGDTLTVSGAWDASAANPQPGETFTIGLPRELGFDQPVPFGLTDGTTVWATCLTDPVTDVATCTFTHAVVDRPEEVRGTFEFDVEVVLATTEEAVEFDLNGSPVMVDLPGEGGIDDGIEVPTEWKKTGQLNGNKWSMSWTIDLPGAGLAGHDVVRVFEDLTGHHALCTPPNLKVQTVRGDVKTDVTSIATVDDDVPGHDFAFVLTAPAGGFDPKVTYRITYDTCTPDRQIDPKGTIYGNEATVDVWGNAGSGVIGVEQDWAIGADVSKSSRVLDGAQRNGRVQWDVTVAGDHLLGQDGFTLTEELSGQHEVCVDTISGIRVWERYGPSSEQQREVTGELDRTTVSSAADTFEVRFDIKDGSDFEFRPSDYQYLIQYQTCVTTDGLPEAGTAFGNQAGVDGTVARHEAKVPARSEGKSGRINTSAVTIDGVEHLPQTTMGWTITVPGERLNDLDSALTVTDTLTAAHQVCDLDDVTDGQDVTARLGLRVQARDQIQNGGLSTVDLTGSATATLTGHTVTITIDQPAGFSREYQYVIDYTTCTTSGGMDAPGTTYGNSATVAGKTYTQTVTQNNRGSGTGTGVTRGSIAISKDLAGTTGADLVPDDTTFTVHVKEISPDGQFTEAYDLDVPVNGDPVSGPNSRGTGWTVELSEPRFPDVPGVTFAAPRFAETAGVTVNDDGTVATVALTPGQNIAVQLTNTALLGSASITKTVTGPDTALALVDPDQRYAITAKIDVSGLDGVPAEPDRTFDVTAGEAYELTDLPIGAEVTFSEARPADSDLLTWAAPQISPSTVTVTDDHATEPARITVTNRVTRTVGTFSVVKDVTGEQAANPAVPGTVEVTATWIEEGTPGSKTLTVPTDGTPVALGEDLLIGTKVTLTETPLADGSSIAWGAPTWSGDGVSLDHESAVVTIGRNAQATVTLQNHAATSTAGLSLLKGIAGEAAGEVPDDTEFPVTLSWRDGQGDLQTREVTISAVEPVLLGEELPAGTEVTITEGERPAFDTVVWGDIVISGDHVTDHGNGSATLIVSDQQDDVTLVTIVNEATWAPGTFSLSKEITGVLGDHPDVPDAVRVTATWLDEQQVEQSKELTIPTDGTVVPFGQQLPHQTEVTLSETKPDDSLNFTWDTPVWAGDATEGHADGTAVVTIGAAQTRTVSLTNNVTATQGSIALLKQLDGDGAADVPGATAYPVTVSWVDLLGQHQDREIELRAGEVTVIDGLPVGSEVQLTERKAELPRGVTWADVSWSSDDDRAGLVVDDDSTKATVTIGEAGATVAVDLTNTMVADDGLPFAGALSGPWATGVLVLLACGFIAAGVWLVRRRAVS